MTEPVAFVSRFRIKSGRRADYERLAAEIISGLETEKPQTSVFLSFLDDNDELTIIHALRDAGAMDRHFEGSDERSQAAMPLLEPIAWEIYGRPSAAAHSTLEAAAHQARVPLREYPFYVGGFLRSSTRSEAG